MKLPTLLILLSVGVVHAGPRTSADYSILTDGLDDGGGQTSSADYANTGSIGGVTGASTPTSTDYATKSGVLGQVYEIVGFLLNASRPPSIQ